MEWLALISTGDKAGGKLGCLNQILRELTLYHLVLHFLQDRILSPLQVLDKDLLTLLSWLKSIKFLKQLIVLLNQLLVLLPYLVHLLSIFTWLNSATIALYTWVCPLSCGIFVVDCTSRPVTQLLVLSCWCRSSLAKVVLLLLIPQSLLQKQVFELLVLLLHLLHVTGHSLYHFLILRDSLFQHISLKFLLV